MSERIALKHGQAKVQYYACREKVYQLREAGYSIQAIYDLLTKDGIISMSYKALHRNISKDRAAAGKEPIIKNTLPVTNTPRPAHSLTVQPIKPSLSPPPPRIAPLASDAAARARAVQESMDKAIKRSESFLNEVESDPEEERLKKELVG